MGSGTSKMWNYRHSWSPQERLCWEGSSIGQYVIHWEKEPQSHSEGTFSSCLSGCWAFICFLYFLPFLRDRAYKGREQIECRCANLMHMHTLHVHGTMSDEKIIHTLTKPSLSLVYPVHIWRAGVFSAKDNYLFLLCYGSNSFSSLIVKRIKILCIKMKKYGEMYKQHPLLPQTHHR